MMPARLPRIAGHFGLVALLAGFLGAGASAATLRTEVPKLKASVSLDPGAGVGAWTESASLPLTWDVPHQRAAADTTDVHVATDGKYLYVRFDAKQRTPVVISQQSDDLVTGGSNGGGGNIAWSDDAVWVDLWPTGAGGFQYQFEANAGGSHNEASTENTAFAPRWESHGVTNDGGYTVTMAIPLAVIHGAPSGAWRAQF
ncbi:MAG TPA: sugar-binding protein, partial [Candidatus Baltobacteraceae bacterium]|nr:sugar-binding protein [Candidatus Baltobacteraceae bacterium]